MIFEQPLNEKCRTLLRLSHLFEQLDYHLPQNNPWEARAALRALLDISVILARADIKSELIKEMDRYHLSLAPMADLPNVDRDRLQHILQNLENSQRALRGIKGQLGAGLRSSEFLNSVLQRTAIPGGGFDFDLPQLHYWLALPQAERLLQLDDWRSEIAAVHEAVELLLGLIRNSTTFSPCQANAGFYSQSLPSEASVQMIRVRLPADSPVYAEISGGKHRFSIRFMDSSDWEHPVQTARNLGFELNVCII
ncbi:MAG: cell division protein ZapD [Gammaproteobacteria bacterium]|nr:MAG: cell division protein ZapD [Gammaproteobacteria bacterium]